MRTVKSVKYAVQPLKPMIGRRISLEQQFFSTSQLISQSHENLFSSYFMVSKFFPEAASTLLESL